MKYVSPKYELSLLNPSDVLMSGEASYTIEESKDESGNVIGDVTINASGIFKQFFN